MRHTDRKKGSELPRTAASSAFTFIAIFSLMDSKISENVAKNIEALTVRRLTEPPTVSWEYENFHPLRSQM
jgi:hypothetical protein